MKIKITNYSALGAHISIALGRENNKNHAHHKIDDELLNEIKRLQEEFSDLEAAIQCVNSIPTTQCRLGEPFLEDNLPWFVTFYTGNSPLKDCKKIITHFNDCYECADIFAMVHANAAPSNKTDGRSRPK